MTPHLSNTCPVAPDAWVCIDLGDGVSHEAEQARTLNWGPGLGPDGEGRILGYTVVGAPADALPYDGDVPIAA